MTVTSHAPAVLLWLFSVLYIALCSFGCSLCCTSLGAPLAVLCAVHRSVLLWLFSVLYIAPCSFGCSLCCTSLLAPLAVLCAVHRSLLLRRFSVLCSSSVLSITAQLLLTVSTAAAYHTKYITYSTKCRCIITVSYMCNRVYCVCPGPRHFNLSFLSFLFFDWLGIL